MLSDSSILQEYMLPDLESTFRLFAAHWRSVTDKWRYPRHSHPLFEINLVLSGSQTMKINGIEYAQNPGDAIIVRPGDVHSSRAAGGGSLTYYCLHFDVDDRCFRELLCKNQDHFYASDSPLAGRIRSALDSLIGLTRGGAGWKTGERMMAMSVIFELFAGISECIANQEEEFQHSSAARIAADMAGQLERHAAGGNRDSVRERDIVNRIARHIGYSTSSCNRMFHQVYGLSPRQYLSSLKLKKAKLLLLEPDLPVESVSDQLGYGSVAHFSRQFKRWTGESPMQFKSRFI